MSALPQPPLRPHLVPARATSEGRRRLERLGAGALEDGELLALAASIPLAVARLALEVAGGLTGLARSDPAELTAVSGMGRARAVASLAAVELGRRAAAAQAEPGWRVRTPADVGERLLPAMRHLEREELRTLLLNTKNVVMAMTTVYAGNLAGSSVRVGEVFRDAVRRQAAAVVVVHNHPSGDPSPSADDLRITAELAEAGRLL
ncbi:MAG TPA: JAB domain-containing protein, partial [Candidatus Dormibacteraeota bacterium]|nr:JAB domain-containing protein [Candidatus Dormibacteraeota bacterium]